MKQRAKSFLILLLKVGFVLAAFYQVFKNINIAQLVSHLEKMDPLWLLFSFIILNCSQYVSSQRSRIYYQEYGLTIDRTFAVVIYYIGMFFNIILPGGIGGDAYKVYLLWKMRGFSKIKSLRIALYERVNGFYALCVLGIVALSYSSFNQLEYVSCLNFLALIFITPLYIFGVQCVLKDKLSAVRHTVLHSFVVQILQVVFAIMLFKAFMAQVDNHLVDFITLFIIASIAAIIPISIGGAGLRELTFLYGLRIIDYPDPELGVAFALVTFVFYVLTALIGLPLWLRSNKFIG
jgi:uncharacterized membrane protein YbhN (UPF0104 family)